MSQHLSTYSSELVALADLPDGLYWQYGGRRFGVEPLIIPPVDSVLSGDRTFYRGRDFLYNRTSADRVEKQEAIFGNGLWAETKLLFWFRWITGHQASFVIWRLMADKLADLEANDCTAGLAADSLCDYIRGYSAMLLYCSSCPRQIYADLIRPTMWLHHSHFSGTWAPDYIPVRSLLRGSHWLVKKRHEEKLRGAVRLHQLVHAGVAEKLVPGGKSLLQYAPSGRPYSKLFTGLMYDNFFVTIRAPATRHQVVCQLLRRLAAIATDHTSQGLYPTRRQDTDIPIELRDSAVTRCEREFEDICLRVGRQACELTARD